MNMPSILRRYTDKLSAGKRKVLANVCWAMLGKGVRILAEIFVGILVARYLGPEQYGTMSYVVSFVSLFSILATFGLDNIEIRELAQGRVAKEVLIGTAFRLKLVFAAVTYAIIGGVVLAFEADGFTQAMIMVYALSVIVNSIGVIRNYFTSIVLNEYVVKTEIFRTIVGVVIKVALLLLRAPLAWFIVAVTFDSFLVASGYLYSYAAKVGKAADWTYDRRVAGHLVRQSFPLLLSGAAVLIYQRIDQVMIRNMIDNASVGYFSIAGKFTELILFLPIVMSQTIAPLLIRARERDEEVYRRKRQQFVDVIVWTALVLAVGVSLGAPWLVRLTYGPQYLAAVPVLQIMAFKAVGMALAASSGQLVIIENLQKWAVVRNLIGCGVCVGMNFLLIPRYGIIGSAWATIFTVAFTGCLANAFIPPYHSILKIQVKSLLLGWRELLRVRTLWA
ncbi:MAG: flippase [Kiritimatiellia bacterium]